MFFLGGTLLFVGLIWEVGVGPLTRIFMSQGWVLPLIIAPDLLVSGCEAWGWMLAFGEKGARPKFPEFFRIRLAAKGIQEVTPGWFQAGELAKIQILVFQGASLDRTIASVVIAKTTNMLAEFLFILMGMTVAFKWISVTWPVIANALFGILILVVGLVLFIIWQWVGLFRPIIWVSQQAKVFSNFFNKHSEILALTDSRIQEYLTKQRTDFGLSSLVHFFGWLAGAIEAWVFLTILQVPVDLVYVILIETWLVIVHRLTGFVPGNLGSQEVGTIAVFIWLGFSAEQAMAFALLRRLRQVVWITLSFALYISLHRGGFHLYRA